MKTDIDLLSSLAAPTALTRLFTERLPAAAAAAADAAAAATASAAAGVFPSECVYRPGLINVLPPTLLRLQTHQNAK